VQAAGEGVAPAVKVFPLQLVELLEGPMLPDEAQPGRASATDIDAATTPVRMIRPIRPVYLIRTPQPRFTFNPMTM
jgi:hypothetical protein